MKTCKGLVAVFALAPPPLVLHAGLELFHSFCFCSAHSCGDGTFFLPPLRRMKTLPKPAAPAPIAIPRLFKSRPSLVGAAVTTRDVPLLSGKSASWERSRACADGTDAVPRHSAEKMETNLLVSDFFAGAGGWTHIWSDTLRRHEARLATGLKACDTGSTTKAISTIRATSTCRCRRLFP